MHLCQAVSFAFSYSSLLRAIYVSSWAVADGHFSLWRGSVNICVFTQMRVKLCLIFF